ncbi:MULTISPECIES: FHA domain-containing protein [Microbacteriaceae]|uniref:FHA domain-containing protein n=1 Tax=Microbacteriaceae TaxID=85023 RepID=UPI000361E50A|nr:MULTISPECIES: FHA domain-containing protein [Microbacteriaceae]TDQ03452.1 FHA domain-containing protein [Leifsonia sp. 115AMFTsu3.1]
MFEVQQAAAGEWAVVAGGARALLVAESDPARLRALFEAVRAGFAETLDALVAGGLSRTPSFALLDASTGPVLLAVRGTASATIADGGPERTVRASGVSSWVETQLTDATAVTLGAAAGETLPLVEGVVRSGGVVWSAAEQTEDVGATVAAPPRRERETGPVDALAVDTGAAGSESASTEQVDPEPVIAGPAVEAFEPAPAEQAPAEPDPHTRVPEATFTDVPSADAAPAPAQPSEAPGYDHLFGATMVRSVEDAAVRPEEEDAAPPKIDLPGFITDSFPPAAGRLAGDHDGLTVMSGDLPQRARPTETEQEPAREPAPQTFAVLLSDGRREPLSAPVVVGRAPSVSAVPALRGARPVTLTTAEDDISRSHVAVAVEGDSVVVTDLHSRNGTMIVLPGKTPQKLRSGEPTTVVLGTVIDLGSGATLTVEAAG